MDLKLLLGVLALVNLVMSDERNFYDSLFNTYETLDKSFNEKYPVNYEDTWVSLSSFNTLSDLKKELLIIDNLYHNYHNLQVKYLKEQKLRISRLTSFANTVLNDPNSAVRHAIERMLRKITHQDLIEVSKVRNSYHFLI